MTNHVCIERQPLFGSHRFVNDPRARIGAGIDGFLIEIYSESQDDTVYVGFYAPADLLPRPEDEGKPWNGERAISFAALAILGHENKDERWNAEDYVAEGADFYIEKRPETSIPWPKGRNLESLAEGASAEWRGLQMEVDLNKQAPTTPDRPGPSFRV